MPEKLQIAAVVLSALSMLGGILYFAWQGVCVLFKMHTSIVEISLGMGHLREKHDGLTKRVDGHDAKIVEHEADLSGIHTHLKLAPNLKAKMAT